MKNGTRFAAVDLGSNSFRLEIGEVDHGQIHRVEYLKETVRLGSGLDEARNLRPEAMQRGWEALARFAERLADFPRSHVRAVATQTLREARNREEFLLRARTVLGFGISVISGHEEARLIYHGVASLLPNDGASGKERRLVIDIGGRSTELILGHALQPQTLESYRVGSVAWSMRYFPQGQFTPEAFRTAEIAAKAVLDEALSLYPAGQWDAVYGASGTIGAVGDVLAAAGGKPGLVTREGLDWLIEQLLRAGSADRLRMEGMREDRRPVIGGGVSVLRALFSLFDLREMHIAQGALRHGLLYELLDRDAGVADLRESTVARLLARFVADAAQARRVADTATSLFVQLVPAAHGASTSSSEGRALRKLGWAAQLHEVGAQISHEEYHRHGAYILANTDAPGFSRAEMQTLGQLVLGHRGKLRKVEAALANGGIFAVQLLSLRLAVLLCHARRDPQPQALRLARTDSRAFEVRCDPAWAEQYPQSAHLLREEAQIWEKAGWRIQLKGA